jgi:predicted RNA polymerase sigma factor
MGFASGIVALAMSLEAFINGTGRGVIGSISDRRGQMDSDDTLVLLFMCCHPSLSPTSQVSLTLRAVGGLSAAEIARAFLV